MRTAIFFAAGALVGLAVAFRLRPTTEGKCCARVSAGARDRVGAECGPLGGFCQKAGDVLGVWQHAPDILDVFGL